MQRLIAREVLTFLFSIGEGAAMFPRGWEIRFGITVLSRRHGKDLNKCYLISKCRITENLKPEMKLLLRS
jgi:hypothetical protein